MRKWSLRRTGINGKLIYLTQNAKNFSETFELKNAMRFETHKEASGFRGERKFLGNWFQVEPFEYNSGKKGKQKFIDY